MSPGPWQAPVDGPIFPGMKALRRTVRPATSEIEGRIKVVLEDVEPLLRIEHCSLAVGGFDSESGQLTVEFRGSCPDCSASPAMFATAIDAHVRQRVPEVRRVVIREK